MSMKIAVITDNLFLYRGFKEIIHKKKANSFEFTFYCSPGVEIDSEVEQIKVRENVERLTEFSLVISLHCKQLFPASLVNGIRCINIHPGLNPYNRGWYPQVFSIINGLPIGVTIHEIDEDLDHGHIIFQKEVPTAKHDTSLSLYNKVVSVELELLEAHFEDLMTGNYLAYPPESEGNLNLKKDFNALCRLDLQDTASLEKHIDLLRALSHGDFKNAYFLNEQGRKVYVKIELNEES